MKSDGYKLEVLFFSDSPFSDNLNAYSYLTMKYQLLKRIFNKYSLPRQFERLELDRKYSLPRQFERLELDRNFCIQDKSEQVQRFAERIGRNIWHID